MRSACGRVLPRPHIVWRDPLAENLPQVCRRRLKSEQSQLLVRGCGRARVGFLVVYGVVGRAGQECMTGLRFTGCTKWMGWARPRWRRSCGLGDAAERRRGHPGNDIVASTWWADIHAM